MRWRTLIVLTLALVSVAMALLWRGHVRPWRATQGEALDRQRAALEEALRSQRLEEASQRERLTSSWREAKEEVARSSVELDEIEADLQRLGRQRRGALRRYQGASGEERRSLRRELEALEEMIAVRTARRDQIRAPEVAAREALAAEEDAVRSLEEQLERLPALPAWLSSAVRLKELRPPGFVDPTDAMAPRVDRCQTCHLESHPDPEFVGGEHSAHPVERFGCTVCHGGDGRATSFEAVGHDGGGRFPLLPAATRGAACASCHSAPNLAAGSPASIRADFDAMRSVGVALFAGLGCGACHGGVADRPDRPGPSLERLWEKTDAAWVRTWLADAAALAPSAWLPNHFPSRHGSSAHREVEIEAVAAALFATAEVDAPRPSPLRGDVERGRRRAAELGCSACHLEGSDGGREAFLEEPWRIHGPDLRTLARKTTAEWIRRFLEAPTSWDAHSRMPDLRLKSRDAADLAVYLASADGRAAAVDEPLREPTEERDPAVRDALLLGYLERDGTLEAAAARLEAMGEEERMVALGRRVLERERCAACHRLPDALSSDPLPRLDLAPKEVLRLGKARAPHRPNTPGAPEFGLSQRESTALMTALLVDALPRVPREAQAESAGDLDVARELEKIVVRRGCRACHAWGGRGGDGLPSEIPSLDGVGARTRPQWVSDYLARPQDWPLRPWLEVPMPSYAFSDAESRALVIGLAGDHGLVVPPNPRPTSSSLALGAATWEILSCDACHGAVSEESGRAVTERSPTYRFARTRLRPDWVVDWLLDPESLEPGTAMPNLLAADGTGSSSSLAGALGAPMHRGLRSTLRRRFESDDELRRWLDDPRAIAIALRDYLWSRSGSAPRPAER